MKRFAILAAASALIFNSAGAAPPAKKVDVFRVVKYAVNLKGVKTRKDTMAGKEYLVVPMVMMTDGVHHGSMGPLYYPAEEFSPGAVVLSWNHKPIVIYHPTENETACSPETITAQGCGVVMNTQATEYEEMSKGKKRKRIKWNAEAWFDEERLKLLDSGLHKRILNGEMIEVSTGLFCESDGISGTWNGEDFEGTVRNYRADHLAVLPDQKGACSIEDGAGLARNEEKIPIKSITKKVSNEASFDVKRGLVSRALSEKYGEYTCYVYDLFTGFCVFDYKQRLYQIKYTATDTQATLVGEPQEVFRVVKYWAADGTVLNFDDERNSHMKTKLQMIGALIAANLFVEADKDFLLKKNDDQIKRLYDSIPAKNTGEETEETEIEETPEVPAKNSSKEKIPIKSITKNSKVPTPAKNEEIVEETPEEFIARAPKGIRNMLANGLRSFEKQRSALIEKIAKNSKLSKERLETKDMEELQELAESLVPKTNLEEGDYSGLADALSGSKTAGALGVTSNKEIDSEPLLNEDFELEAPSLARKAAKSAK